MEEILSSPTVPTKCKLRNSDNELTFSDRHHTYLKGPASKREIVLIKTQNTTSDDIYQTLLAAADGLFSLEEYQGGLWVSFMRKQPGAWSFRIARASTVGRHVLLPSTPGGNHA